MPRGIEYFRGLRLTGVKDLKNKHKDQSAAILCSGPTFAQYDPKIVPGGFVKFSINETISHVKKHADYWVLSDIITAEKYGRYCPEETKVISVHRASEIIDQHCSNHEIFTVQSTDSIEDYNDGYRFFSRRTVMIAAVELGRYMGITRFYCFGLDLFRTKNKYYFDGTEANYMSERNPAQRLDVRGRRWKGERIFQTPNLRAASQMLSRVKKAGLWNGVEVFCVNSECSAQDAIPKMTMQDFMTAIQDKPKKRRGRPPGSKNKPKVNVEAEQGGPSIEQTTHGERGIDEQDLR